MNRLKNKDFNITILTVGITVLLQFFFIRYASYDISKIDYGNFVLLQTLIAGLSSVFLQIPGQAFDRFYNGSENKNTFINEFRTLLIVINLLSIVFIIIYGIIMQKFSIVIMIIVFIFFLLMNNYALNQKVFLLNLQRTKYFYLKVMEAFSKFLLPIVFYTIWRSLESLLIGIVVGYSLSYIMLHYFLKESKFSLIINPANLKKYFHFASPIIFVSISTWGISFSDRYFIEYYLSTKDVAIYSLLAMVAGVGSIIGQIYFMYAEPKILKKFEVEPEETFRMINSYLKKLVALFGFLLIVAFVLPKEVYTILLEKDIVENDYYFTTMMILLVAIFVNILHIAHHMHLKLMKRLDVLAYVFLVAFIVNLIGNLFIQQYGIMAAAFATLAGYITIFFLQILYVTRSNYRVING